MAEDGTIKVEMKGEYGEDGLILSAENVHIHLPSGCGYRVERAGSVMQIEPIINEREADNEDQT